MNVSVTAASGLAEKSPAAFVVELQDRRFLLDLGQGSQEERPPAEAIGQVDALLISHAHADHCGALDLLPAIGNPLVHATRSVLERLEITGGVELPATGEVDVCGIDVLTGRAGHALGSIWMRVGGESGVLYMGDCFVESNAFDFDPPPPAETLIHDASYGDAKENRQAQLKHFMSLASEGPLHCPVPPDGRGIELALALSAAGCAVAIDGNIRAMLQRLAGPDSAFALPGVAEHAALIAGSAAEAAIDFAGVILTADATGAKGVSARLIAERGDGAAATLLFTGHVAEGTPGHQLVAAGIAGKMRWNVHPTFAHNLALVRRIAPSRILAAFGPSSDSSGWRQELLQSANGAG